MNRHSGFCPKFCGSEDFGFFKFSRENVTGIEILGAKNTYLESR